jgi:hypothetical protein
VHKISTYIHIYVRKRGKWRKGKRKRFLGLSGSGGISAQPKARVPARRSAQLGPLRGTARGGDAVGAGPHASEGRGTTSGGGGRRSTRGGENRPPVISTAVPRRWSGSG